MSVNILDRFCRVGKGPIGIGYRPRVGVSGAFNPADLQADGEYLAMLYALNGSSPYYHASGLSGVQYLDSKERYGSYRAPRQGRCWLFDGTDDYGLVPSAVGSAFAGSFSVSMWVKPTSLHSGTLLSVDVVTSMLAYVDVTGRVAFGNGTGLVFTTVGTYAAGDMLHIGLVHDTAAVGFDRYKVYVNGTLLSTTTSGTYLQPVSGTTVRLGQRTNGTIPYIGAMRDVRIYNVAKDATSVANIYAGATDLTGLVAQYPGNEESGTIGYDASGNGNHLTLTNITEGTFHATDTAVTSNPANSVGYTLSGSVIVPRDESDPTLDVLGGSLQYTGRCPYPVRVDTPCITGDGSTVYADLGSALIPATADYSCTCWLNTGSSASHQYFISQYVSPVTSQLLGLYRINSTLTLFALNTSTSSISISDDTWYPVTISRVSNLHSLTVGTTTVTVTQAGTVSSASTRLLMRSNGLPSFGKIADLRITTGGVTTYFPIQDGPGSSNTNRHLAYIRSDGTYGVVSNAIVNGTVSTIWTNTVPGYVRDWCMEYGGGIAANGAFLPGQISGTLAADGTAKTLAAGKVGGNPFSRRNNNPFTAAEFNGRSIATSIAGGDAAAGTPSDSSFHRVAADGTDRLLVFTDALTGDNLTAVEDHTT